MKEAARAAAYNRRRAVSPPPGAPAPGPSTVTRRMASITRYRGDKRGAGFPMGKRNPQTPTPPLTLRQKPTSVSPGESGASPRATPARSTAAGSSAPGARRLLWCGRTAVGPDRRLRRLAGWLGARRVRALGAVVDEPQAAAATATPSKFAVTAWTRPSQRASSSFTLDSSSSKAATSAPPAGA